jgi:hypothetical protein
MADAGHFDMRQPAAIGGIEPSAAPVHVLRRRAARRRYGSPARSRASADRQTFVALAIILLSCIFLQRFAIPVGTAQIAVSFAVSYAAFAYLLLSGSMTINPILAVTYLGMAATLTLVALMSDDTLSLSSFIYLLSIYALYLFRLKHKAGAYERTLDVYQDAMMVCAVLGVAQFAGQFVMGSEMVFPIDLYVSDTFLVQKFNVIIPLTYSSSIMKANGVVFLEPSFFSQFLALSLVIELLHRKRARRLALILAGMIVSYSGTGLSLAVLFGAWILLRQGNFRLVMLACAMLVILAIGGEALNLSIFVDRIGEFGSRESSGFARFISPFYLISDFLITSPKNFLFGLGPGSIQSGVSLAASYDYLAHDATWIKLLYEYGAIGSLLLLGYMALALFAGSRDRILAGAILYLFLFLGGYLLNGIMHSIFVALLVWHNMSSVPVKTPSRRPLIYRLRPASAPRLRPSAVGGAE